MPRPRSPSHRRRPLAWLLAALGLAAVPFPANAAIDEHLGQGMPLVLKDGRIANVTVHTIPFTTGAEILAPAAQAAVETTFRPLATDCFLTAQAIGHVAPGVGRDGDTLAAHRLARARADGIQALLAGLGMPQPAVASVWDWQFLVQESQVTLWIFSLNVGDDCEGTPLSVDAPNVADLTDPLADPAVAELPELPVDAPALAGEISPDDPESQPADAAVGAVEATPRALQIDTDDSQSTVLDTTAASTTEPTPAEDLPPALVAVPADAAATADLEMLRSPDPLATAAVGPADTAPQPATPPATAAATIPEPDEAPAATEVAALDAAAPSPTASADAPDLVITFDVNSSFFPAGAGRELRAFLRTLPEAQPVALALEVAVGTGDVRGASGEEARRYNTWMAERRVQRVAEWLVENAGDRPITLTEQQVENDPSREVRLFATVSR